MYQKTAAEHFAEAMTRLTKHPHRFAPAGDQPHTEQPEAPRGSAFANPGHRSGTLSPLRSVERPVLAASPSHTRWAGA